MAFREGAALEQHQLLEALQEIVVVAGILPAPQGIGGDRIGARRAPEPEIDASGKQRFEHLESLGDHQRRMIGKHDAAGSHPHALGRRCDLPDHDVGSGACDRRQVVMLGNPIAGEAEAVGEPGEVERVAQRNRPGGRGGDRRKVEDGERKHAGVRRFRTATGDAAANPSSSRSAGLCETAARGRSRPGRSLARPAEP